VWSKVPPYNHHDATLTSKVSLQLLLEVDTPESGESESAAQEGGLSLAPEIFQSSWCGPRPEGGIRPSNCTADDEKITDSLPSEGGGAAKNSYSTKDAQQNAGKPQIDTTSDEKDEVAHPLSTTQTPFTFSNVSPMF
jgi:hypothetical protein